MRVALAESSIPSPRDVSCVFLSLYANKRQASTFPSTVGNVSLGDSLALVRCAVCTQNMLTNAYSKCSHEHKVKHSSMYLS